MFRDIISLSVTTFYVVTGRKLLHTFLRKYFFIDPDAMDVLKHIRITVTK